MQKNQEITIQITAMTSEGSGVGRHDGMAIFVPNTAVGDTVLVRIVKVKKTYAYGKVAAILTPSPDRCEPDCPVSVPCGGCVYRHMRYEAECTIKANKVYEAIKRIGGVDMAPQPMLCADNEARYRNKAQYPFSVDGKAGFYAMHSHRVVPCADCKLQPAVFADIVSAVEDFVEKYHISLYDEAAHTGLLRHLYLRLAEATGELMVTLVINGETLPHSEPLIERLQAVGGEALKSVQLNHNTADTNVILGERCTVLYGAPTITDVLCGLSVRLSPLSFYQVNRQMAQRLYEKAADYAAPDGAVVLDLYCGAGTIGLSMAHRAKQVIGVEIVAQAVEDARHNAAANGIENARFLCADAADAARQLAAEGVQPDVVIVDPPRKGCEAALLSVITDRFCPDRVVYVSCDPATLARDLQHFTAHGYTLCEYTPADLFPRTAHVETVALLSREKADDDIRISVHTKDLQTNVN